MLPRRLAWIVKKWMNDVTCTLILTKEGKLSLDEFEIMAVTRRA